MKDLYTVAVDFNKLVDRIAKQPECANLPRPILHMLLTTVAITSMHFLDENNDNLALAAFQVNALCDRVFSEEGVEKSRREAIYNAVDRIYAEVYEQAIDEVRDIRKHPQSDMEN